jgi:hypothetical protein
MIPNEIQFIIIEVPPRLIIGKVTPVTGTKWVATAIFIKA